MLDRFFGGCGKGNEFFGGCGWWIIILFFLFLAFQDCWDEIEICDWIPFLIVLLIVISCGQCEDECGC
ncbi:hypothetical protein [Metaclostridioides mangenotii]|jgi:hypothetical protein|uniref:hypothetical protein n=1 Tax=Metaclostridioides mangenotii TaxID=1540 RepID=UPI0004828C95|nr:hypothetical protein [Clostridioides mangenotii]